jgi:hypothetical protein
MCYSMGSMHAIPTRLMALLAATFVALTALPFTSTSYLCHMTGKVSESRCCSGYRENACHAQVEQPDCCELMQGQGPATAADTRACSHDVPIAALIDAPTFAMILQTPVTPVPSPRAQLHPPRPPRFLLNCALLI